MGLHQIRLVGGYFLASLHYFFFISNGFDAGAQFAGLLGL
jgi:formate hydrogenlyase subunit 4